MVAFAARKSKDMGNVAFQKKEYEEALEHYAGALLGNCPDRHKIYSNRSACLFQLGKYTEALVEATEAIKADRAWSKGYYRAGRAALEMEYYEEALEMFEKGLDREPSNQDLVVWAKKARDLRNQHKQDKLIKKHETDYSKFSSLVKQEEAEEEEDAIANDPNRIVLGDKYYTSSKMEQRQLKAMLGYKEDPPPPFEPTFNSELVFRHDARGLKTQHPVWDPIARDWKLDARPAPSRVDYSDSTQAQAIASFLERQSDVQYAEDLLTLLDQRAEPVGAYVEAVRGLVAQLVLSGGSDGNAAGPRPEGGEAGDGQAAEAEGAVPVQPVLAGSSGRRRRTRRGVLPDDARWLFVGAGSCLAALTAARYVPTAEIVVNSAHRATYIAELALAIFAQNKVRKEQVRFVHRPSQELAVVGPESEDINNLTGRVDVVVFDFELFDPGLLGKGILAKVNHAKKKLVATEHFTVPFAATVSCVPCEILCPRGDGPDALDWHALDECRWGAFYESWNADDAVQEPWRPLGPVLRAFDFDFAEPEVPTAGHTDLRFVATEDGVLTCIVFWYRLDLVEGVSLDHEPRTLRRQRGGGASGAGAGGTAYPRQACQWLPAPLRLRRGDEVVIRASYSHARIRFEIASPEPPASPPRRVALPRWLFLRLRDEERADAFSKAIEKAIGRIMADREAVDKLDRPPLRVAHLGAGCGQLSMLTARCLRDAGVSEIDVATNGYMVVALEQMPKIGKVARRAFRDNSLDKDVFLHADDVRKLPDQPRRAQLLVCELFDPGLLGEGLLPLLAAARVKLCSALDHQVLPSRAKIWAAAFEFGAQLKSCHGFDLSALNHYRGGHMVDVDAAVASGAARQLSPAFEALCFDLETGELPARRTVNFVPTETGNVSAFVFWYELFLDREGEIILTNWPEAVPPADFAMMERDLHRPSPLRQAVSHLQGDYIRPVVRGEAVDIEVGYSEAWPQFLWPGTEMVRTEQGESIPKPPPMPMHRLRFEKFRRDVQDLERKLQGGLMYEEELLSDAFAAAERIALEPNGNPNYLINPDNANFFHMMFFI
eukprot:TRINITY_DN22402_c0_g1_i3.p1 TRINITY_DN22402_c0_g1~~TRINITY_DN22402_c0_g1_i3.p1  ORF type:complete len:1147 (+),score=296.47 TRINITY_DN22402_c0_g1_i3:272-3442(+)